MKFKKASHKRLSATPTILFEFFVSLLLYEVDQFSGVFVMRKTKKMEPGREFAPGEETCYDQL